MQADMYNLYPAIGEVNGRRSNYSMAIIKGEKREFGKCDVEIKSRKIEPKKVAEERLQEHICIWILFTLTEELFQRRIRNFLSHGIKATL